MRAVLLSLVLGSALYLGLRPAAGSQAKQHNHPPRVVALKAGEPTALAYDAGTVRFLVSSEDTEGAWSLQELTELPGYKTRWHRHNQMDEAFYVLEGVLTAKIADTVHELPAGSYILIPRGTPHGQANVGNTPVKVLLTLTPGGFERVFRERVELFKTVKPDHADFTKKFEEVRGRYAEYIEILGTWDLPK